jgi:hypothetical protein
MCHAFSCLVMKNGNVIWEAGIDSHDDLEEKYKVRDTGKSNEPLKFARVKIVPDNGKKYPYLYPELKWQLNIDERVKPDWWSGEFAQKAQVAFEQWKSQIYQFKYEQIRNPINPLGKKRKPNSNDIQLLKQWASVWASVRASVSEYFPNIKQWRYIQHEVGTNPYQCVIDLWDRGLIPSFDGKIWRLHSGKRASIVYEISKQDLKSKG